MAECREDMGNVSDGYHTFNELYAHRRALTAALLLSLTLRQPALLNPPWRSLLHHDGALPFGGGWFIVGVTLPGAGQVTYHYEMQYWSLFDGLRTLDRAEPYDGHSSMQAVVRLERWIINESRELQRRG